MKRKIDWINLLGEQAWLAEELAPILNIKPVTVRRHLKIAEARRVLVSKNKGRYKYFMLRKVYERKLKECCEI